MASLVGQLVFSLDNNGYKAWEDPSFIKWRKRDPHVTLHCHDSVEGLLLSIPMFVFASNIVAIFF
jgi:beta-galactosidase